MGASQGHACTIRSGLSPYTIMKIVGRCALIVCLGALGCANSGQTNQEDASANGGAVGVGGAFAPGGANGMGGSNGAGRSGAGGVTGSGGASGSGGATSSGGGGTGGGAGGVSAGGATGKGGAGGGSSGRSGSSGGGGAQAGGSGSGGVGGANNAGGMGGSAGAVDGWYEAEAVPPNVLTNAATMSHSDEGKDLPCPPDVRPGLSAAQAHGVTEGANCASGGGMVVNILGRSPCNPETPSSYTACQNLGAGVEFHDVAVPTDGTYDVTWWYHCGLNDHYGDTKCGGVHYPVGSSCRPHLIDVNGVPMSSAGAKYFQFPCYSTAWTYIHATTTALPLKAGSNVIYIHAPGATTLDAADIDAINVLPQGKGAPPLATPVMSGN